MVLSTLLVSALLFLARADEEAVVTLTSENFNSFITDSVAAGTKVLVEFYAPWCGHCKALAPEYEKAAQALKADESINAVLAKVDATVDKDLASKYGVRGFPTLKFFAGDIDSPADYGGGRTESTIVSWIRTRSMPPVSQLTSADEVEAFKSKSKVVLVGFLDAESDAAKALNDVAEANRESVVVGQVSSADVKVDGAEFGKVYMYRSFDEPVVEFSGDLTADALSAFVKSEMFPLIDQIGPENYKDYVDRGLPLLWIATNVEEADALQSLVDSLLPFAKDAKGSLSFVYVDAVKLEQHVQNLGITSTPGMLIAGDSNKKYLFKGDITSGDDLKSFFDGYKAGTLEAYMKSEPIPETNDEPVYVLVGKAFDDVIGKDKDVFVEYYAPWCGHCKKLAPEYEKVGEAFANVENVVIAKVDATENDTPEDISGFPTLIFYPAGQTAGIKYSGERSSDAIVSFIKEKATVDVSGIKEEL